MLNSRAQILNSNAYMLNVHAYPEPPSLKIDWEIYSEFGPIVIVSRGHMRFQSWPWLSAVVSREAPPEGALVSSGTNIVP